MPAAPPPPAGVPQMVLAFGMAFLAGATDVFGLTRLGDLFVSFMSGNTTMLGAAVGRAEWGRVASTLVLVGLFVTGAALGAAIRVAAGRLHAVGVTVLATALLAVPLAAPGLAVAAFTVAMGMVNSALSSIDGVAVSLTYVTGTLVKLGHGIGRALCGQPDGFGWLWQVPMWLSLLAGAVAAEVAVQVLGGDVLWPLPVLSAALTVIAVAESRFPAPP